MVGALKFKKKPIGVLIIKACYIQLFHYDLHYEVTQFTVYVKTVFEISLFWFCKRQSCTGHKPIDEMLKLNSQ